MKFIYLAIFAIILISIVGVQAWELQKSLVQIEVDENYPCYIIKLGVVMLVSIILATVLIDYIYGLI